jgi:hypothetical protein
MPSATLNTKKTPIPKPKVLCPTCWDAGVENELIYKVGSTIPPSCSNGHRWEDSDFLSAALMKMNQERKARMPAPPPVIEPLPDPDAPPPDTRIKIEEMDKERLVSILGTFTDSSSLFGSVFALNEELKVANEKAKRADDRISAGMVKRIGGDVPVTIMIPERHAQPIADVAASSGLSLDRYIQAQAEEALDNAWWY